MEYLPIAFIAGLLTVFAPCVFTLLPVILGRSLQSTVKRRAAIVILSLAASIFVFTLILKASTLLIDVDPSFWKIISGGLLIIFGLITLFPGVWDWLNFKVGLSAKSEKNLQTSSSKQGLIGDIAVGASLGPVFSSCSPTYSVIIATILPQSFFIGIINLLAYILGLVVILALITLFGQRFTKNLKGLSNPKSNFKKFLGVIFLLVGLMIITDFDKRLEIFLLDNGLFNLVDLELSLLENSRN